MRNIFITTAAAAIFAAAPAYATNFSVAMTNGGTAGSNTDARTYNATSNGQTLNVKVTGWTDFGFGVGRSAVGSYGTDGLGITNAIESGAYGSHQADSYFGTDFFILQFDQAVKLTSAVFNTFDLYGSAPDNNALIRWGNTATAWNGTMSVDSLSKAFTGSAISYGNGMDGSRSLALGSTAIGNIWMISTMSPDAPKIFDAFKLAGVNVSSVAAVPEPATWAMMLVGFAMIGAAARYRRRSTTAVYA
ncbi:PEPxxWA-CTERM sorting domain-containing protein [Sphingomonas abaci]|uniref:Ice-binding protein C-terminal domain-containing protein n=1 Tax=Sphingomonas abaci TaxID=237611 RepID=A0A7W7ALZ0_9SPHN|nr:PEPxxWA-CTERM sorting domain-containing protein [Sphingomonas abaci]MBB4619528.1 hypothetical protein [Sphingomonas abaci]